MGAQEGAAKGGLGGRCAIERYFVVRGRTTPFAEAEGGGETGETSEPSLSLVVGRDEEVGLIC